MGEISKPELKITINELALEKETLRRLSRAKGKQFTCKEEVNQWDFKISREEVLKETYKKTEALRQLYPDPIVLQEVISRENKNIATVTVPITTTQTTEIDKKESFSRQSEIDCFTQLKIGSKGPEVVRLQEIINKWNPYSFKEIKEDGIFNESLAKAIAYFSQIYNLGNSGEITSKTALALLRVEDGTFWQKDSFYYKKNEEQGKLYEKIRKHGLFFDAKQKHSLASRYKIDTHNIRYKPLYAGDSLSVIINQAARKYDLDPSLIRAIIKVESGGNRWAVSGCGAQGYMQLMPDTARMLGVNDPFNPRENITGGTRYLRQHLNEFGSLEMALAAYNAGPGKIRYFGRIPPYSETKEFVNKVLTCYAQYNRTSQININKGE